VSLVQERNGRFGFLVFLPVYTPGAPVGTVAQRRDALRGFVLGVFRFADIVETAVGRLRPGGVDIRLTDASASADKRLLYFHPSRTRPADSPVCDDMTNGPGCTCYARQFNLGGRELRILCAPPPGYFTAHRTWQPWIALTSGLACTLLLAGYYRAGHRRVLRAQGVVARVNRKLRRAKNAAEAANRAKSEFLANMSHEIRTPMTAILGYADLLSQANISAAEREEFLRTIQRSGNHLLGVINDILDLSKIEAGKMTVERIACSPRELAGEAAASMRKRAAARNLSLDVECRGPIPEVIYSDPTRLRQILINLLGNAVKFTEHGGVRLAVQMTTPVASPTPRLGFEVNDTGVGIAPQQMASIFQPFSQADSSTTRQFGGTGLGLTISRRLARMLGGDLTGRSTPGRGSSFLVTVAIGSPDAARPAQEPQPAARDRAAGPRPSAPADLRLAGRVLLVEDGADNQRLIAFLLTRQGAAVELAENGQAAVDMVVRAHGAGEPFDCILMDIQMPVLDGYGATRQLRQLGFGMPIIALTAHTMPDDRRRCLDAGCDDYVSKPVDRGQLLHAVARHLRSSSGQTAARSAAPGDAPGPG
jgi:signal transduction histidine kinase/CheY-like chemotaxis protein